MNKDLLRIAFKPLTLINRIVKKEDIVFFYSNLGFRDNVKAFYDYLIENKYNEKCKIVVSINDWKHYVDNSPKGVEFVDNKQGIKYFLKSKYAFYCFGKYPIKPAKNQMVVNLWHGMPLKRIGNMEKGLEKIDYNYFTKIISTAKLFNPILMESFSCKEEQVVIMGQPRNDELFRENPWMDESIRKSADKVLVWLPTYRDEYQEIPIPGIDLAQLNELNKHLEELETRLIVKIHPLQKFSEELKKLTNIEFITQDMLNKSGLTVYSLLRASDALITDYSSVYFDYLLLDRPIGFSAPDIKKYNEERGFSFENPFDYMPGPDISNLEALKKFISDVKYGEDEYKVLRGAVNEKVNFYKDGNSSKRIAEAFLSELGV